jgi:hypothetical protein
VEIKVAVETRTLIKPILVGQLGHFLGCLPPGEEGDVLASLSGADAFYARGMFCRWLGVESYAF